MGLDPLERKFSFGGAAAALILAVVYATQLGKTTIRAVTARPSANGTCAKGLHLAGQVCHGFIKTQGSAVILAMIIGLVMGGALAIFAYRRNRPGAIVASLLLGFLTGSGGILFMFLGGWLAIRAFRLQKYGDPTFRGANVKARENAQLRRAGRQAGSSKSSKSSTSASPPGPAASKRYTPKKTNRR